jgi:hypothetical protein
MKKVMYSIAFLAILIALLPSCKTTENLAASNNPVNTGMIQFDRSYTTNKGTTIIYTLEDLRKIDFFLSDQITLNSRLFRDNYQIVKGVVVIKDSDLDSLKIVPAGTKLKVGNDSSYIVQDKYGNVTDIALIADRKAGQSPIKIEMWFKRSGTAFILDRKQGITIHYKGNMSDDATADAEPNLLYMVDEKNN